MFDGVFFSTEFASEVLKKLSAHEFVVYFAMRARDQSTRYVRSQPAFICGAESLCNPDHPDTALTINLTLEETKQALRSLELHGWLHSKEHPWNDEEGDLDHARVYGFIKEDVERFNIDNESQTKSDSYRNQN